MATKKKGAAKKAVKKGAAKKAPAKKAAAKKAAAKKAAPRKVAAKKVAAKKGSAAKKGTARKVAAKTARKTTARKTAPKKKRAPNPAFMRPVQPDETLAAVVGAGAMPRTEVTSKLWAYIRKNGLQDAKERRMINADEKLGKVFGGKKQVSMFEMTKLVNKHIK
jgi:chromatin remodeling complex protein RSC6